MSYVSQLHFIYRLIKPINICLFWYLLNKNSFVLVGQDVHVKGGF